MIGRNERSRSPECAVGVRDEGSAVRRLKNAFQLGLQVEPVPRSNQSQGMLRSNWMETRRRELLSDASIRIEAVWHVLHQGERSGTASCAICAVASATGCRQIDFRYRSGIGTGTLCEASLLISSGLDQIVIDPSGAEASGMARIGSRTGTPVLEWCVKNVVGPYDAWAKSSGHRGPTR